MKAPDISLSQLDVITPERYGSHGYPHENWARLRRERPLAKIEIDGFDPFWAVTKHADVIAISKQPQRFVSAPRMTMMHNSVRPPEAVRKDPNFKSLLRTLLNMDNPDHRAYRKLVSGWFTPRAIGRLAPRIDDIVAGILDEIEARQPEGVCDFVTDFAARVPLRVIAAILGVPREDEGFVLKLSNQGIGAQDPEFQIEGQSVREARRAVLLELFGYFSALADKRRAEPRDDLATVLANATLGGEPLPQLELLSYFGLIAVAGHETTRNATSGGMAAFLDHPGQWDLLRREPARINAAAEEIIRWTSPVIQFARTATENTEMRDQMIRAEDTLVLFYPSANRDEEVFPDPHTFRIDREPNPHLAFGIGEHLCLGAHLARLELRAIFRQLAERFENIEPAGDRQFLVSSFVGGIKHLPVRYRFRGAAA